MCTHEKKKKKESTKCRCFQCLCTRGWTFVKCQMSDGEKETNCIILFCFSRVHQGCHLTLKCFEYVKKEKEMVWILLLVHITLHGMIGGLSKHVPKAVCRIVIFICKNISECQRRKLFSFLYLCLDASLVTMRTTSTSPI